MKRTNLDEWICRVEGLDHLTRENLEALQLKRLNAVLAKCRARGGVYRDYPERLSRLDALSALPFTTSRTLSSHPGQFLLTSQADVARVISELTSGTSGPAKRVFYTQRDIEHTIGFFAAGISEMARPGDSVFIAMPFSGPMGLGDLISRAVERVGARPVAAGVGKSYGAQRQLVLETRPVCYIGFPAALLGLARFYGPDFPVKRALISGDACPPGVEALLARRFTLFPHYGSREMCLGGAVTCPAHEGMHLRENHVIPEIVDEHGHPMPEGEAGELVITTIGLEAMPLIRYRTGDRARILPGPCPCGGVTKRLAEVTRLDAQAAAMNALDDALFSLPSLIDYRARLRDGTLVIDALCLAPRQEAAIWDRAAALYPSVRVNAAQCTADHGPLHPGKRRLSPGNA